MWHQYVALGDSMTEGYGDEVIGMEKRPWPEYIADYFEVEIFYNLAKSGLRSDQVWEQQFAYARSLQPDLVSVIAGANDLIQKKWNPFAYRKRMKTMVEAFTRDGATVVTCTLPDFTRYLSIPSYMKPFIRTQIQWYNAIMNEVAQQHCTVHIHFWKHPLTEDLSCWSEDRIHPNALGYACIGQLIIEQLENEKRTRR